MKLYTRSTSQTDILQQFQEHDSDNLFKNKLIKESAFYDKKDKRNEFLENSTLQIIKYIRKGSYFKYPYSYAKNEKSDFKIISKKEESIPGLTNKNISKVKVLKIDDYYMNTAPDIKIKETQKMFFTFHKPSIKPSKKIKSPIHSHKNNFGNVLHEKELKMLNINFKPLLNDKVSVLKKYFHYLNKILETNTNGKRKEKLNKANEEKDMRIVFHDEYEEYLDYVKSLKKENILTQKASIILNKVKNKSSSIIHFKEAEENKFLSKVLFNVLRKVTYMNDKNVELSEDRVVNLIKNEAEGITKHLDIMMESQYKIKNFSTFIEETNSNRLLPFVDGISMSPIKSNLKFDQSTFNTLNNSKNLDTVSSFYKTRGVASANKFNKTQYLANVLSPIGERNLDSSFYGSSEKKVNFKENFRRGEEKTKNSIINFGDQEVENKYEYETTDINTEETNKNHQKQEDNLNTNILSRNYKNINLNKEYNNSNAKNKYADIKNSYNYDDNSKTKERKESENKHTMSDYSNYANRKINEKVDNFNNSETNNNINKVLNWGDNTYHDTLKNDIIKTHNNEGRNKNKSHLNDFSYDEIDIETEENRNFKYGYSFDSNIKSNKAFINKTREENGLKLSQNDIKENRVVSGKNIVEMSSKKNKKKNSKLNNYLNSQNISNEKIIENIKVSPGKNEIDTKENIIANRGRIENKIISLQNTKEIISSYELNSITKLNNESSEKISIKSKAVSTESKLNSKIEKIVIKEDINERKLTTSRKKKKKKDKKDKHIDSIMVETKNTKNTKNSDIEKVMINEDSELKIIKNKKRKLNKSKHSENEMYNTTDNFFSENEKNNIDGKIIKNTNGSKSNSQKKIYKLLKNEEMNKDNLLKGAKNSKIEFKINLSKTKEIGQDKIKRNSIFKKLGSGNTKSTEETSPKIKLETISIIEKLIDNEIEENEIKEKKEEDEDEEEEYIENTLPIQNIREDKQNIIEDKQNIREDKVNIREDKQNIREDKQRISKKIVTKKENQITNLEVSSNNDTSIVKESQNKKGSQIDNENKKLVSRKFKKESFLNNKSRGIAPNVTELEKEKYSIKMKSMAKNLSDMEIMLNQNSTNNSKLLRDKQNVLKDFNLKLDIDFQMTQQMTEEGKKKFQELKEKLDSMKNFDANLYIDNIERNFIDMRDELHNLNIQRIKEERIYNFLKFFYDNREQSIRSRQFIETNLKSRDSKFKMIMGPIFKKE